MEVVNKKVDELIPYINNPRRNEGAVDKVASSIKNFGFKVPIIIDKDNEIVAGHTRLEASKKLGLKEVPCVVADDLTEKQIKAFRIADNKVSEYSEWDEDLLALELEGLEDIFTGFDDKEIEDLISGEDDNEIYSLENTTPQYEITGEKPDLSELFNDNKTNVLVQDIMESEVDEDIKEFLIKAAQRHTVFSYSKIAEYYAHAGKEVQELMEKSALVIIDYDNAIEDGYVELGSRIQELMSDG